MRFLKIVYCKQGAGTGVESRAGAPGLEKSRNRRKQKARFGWNVFGYSVCRPILLSVYLYVCIFVYLSVCLSVLNSNSNSLAVLHYFTFISLAMLVCCIVYTYTVYCMSIVPAPVYTVEWPCVCPAQCKFSCYIGGDV